MLIGKKFVPLLRGQSASTANYLLVD